MQDFPPYCRIMTYEVNQSIDPVGIKKKTIEEISTKRAILISK
ncbi:hypothetical protein [Gracilibacillus sp. JCM 18860]